MEQSFEKHNKKSGKFRDPGDLAWAKEVYKKEGVSRCAVCGQPTENKHVYCEGHSGEATGEASRATVNDELADYE